VIEQTPEGWWVIKEDECISKWVREEKRLDYDQPLLRFILPHIHPGDTVVDVGASIGDHTIAYLATVGDRGTVIAYEPNPDAFNCLELNCPMALREPYALGNQIGPATLNLFSEADPRRAHVDLKGFNQGHRTNIRMTMLDREIPTYHVDFIKIDVEGWESEVLKGAADLIERCRPFLWIEHAPALESQCGLDHGEVRKFLEDHRYSVSFLNGRDWDAEYDELFCSPLPSPDLK